MAADEMILIKTLKAIEPCLIYYFAYDRAMLYTEIKRIYYAIHPSGLWGVTPEDKYRVEASDTLGELVTSDNPFDYLRYVPREKKMIKVVDMLAYMTDNIPGILLKDDELKNKIEKLVKENNMPEKYQVAILHVLWIVAVIYKKHEAFKPILDLELLDDSYDMDIYFKQIRPEMLQLYLFLKKDKRKKDKSITLSNNQEKITINNDIAGWFTNLLDSYLHIYLGVDSIEKAEEELKEVYSPKKGRKVDNPAQNLVMVGLYRFLIDHSGMEKKSNIYTFILKYMETIGLVKDEENQIDENYINAKIAYLEKQGYKPEWISLSQGNYRTSPNNPSELYFW